MRRKLSLFTLCVVLLVGAVANYNTISYPQRKMTTYFRTHEYNIETQTPDYETDVPATLMDLAAINLAIAFTSLVVLIAGGLILRKEDGVASKSKAPFKATIDAIVRALETGRMEVLPQVIDYLTLNAKLDVYERFAKTHAKKQLGNEGSIKIPDVSTASIVKEWLGKPNATRTALVKSIQDRMGLDDKMAQVLGDAVCSTLIGKLIEARQSEISKIFKLSGKQRLENEAAQLSDKLFMEINFDIPDEKAVWNVIAEAYKLPH